MLKKLHLYGARLRMVTLLLISGVTIISTRSCHHPTEQAETTKSAQITVANNKAVEKTPATVRHASKINKAPKDGFETLPMCQ